MKTAPFVLATVGVALLFTSCQTQTRSISDPGLMSSNRLYVGELTEQDVIGSSFDTMAAFDDDAIAAAARSFQVPELRAGSRVMLVQSGALIPDRELVSAFDRAFSITTYSGTPTRVDGLADPATGEIARPPVPLRMAAARGGLDTIICVWGSLETEQRDTNGRLVSWVPFLGWGIEDTELDTRLRLRFLVVDVASGNWTAYEPEPVRDLLSLSPLARDLRDDVGEEGMTQALMLKQAAYAKGVESFLAQAMR